MSSDVTCPIKAGHYDQTVSAQFPSTIPPGKYKGKVIVTDQKSNQVACIQFALPLSPSPASEQVMELDAPILDDNLIDYVNSIGEWKAHRNPKFEKMTLRQAKKHLGTRLDRDLAAATPVVLHAEAIPTAFDARQKWPNCVHPIRDQQQCGSCWAFGATEALSDRFCIASSGSVNLVLSPEDLVSCDDGNYGCDGGYLDVAWQYFENKGVVPDTCFPYTAGSGIAPTCQTKCSDGSTPKRYFIKQGSIVQPKDVASIQTLIMNSGPVEAAFNVYQDFFAYKSGIYSHKSGGLAGGHAIKVVGWGQEGGVNYWICANSWGTSWGMSGFFNIKMGDSGINDNIVAGTPQL
eukprot:TRINITY_DN18065_c0_g1_i1.p2 TRINITY_DN18065_c0_g1~~TRINITY_DN18065_c0_g1_i1.p2  ORF type:complete len:391 (+),score=105.21 TRINITY_DN18065_c0_g1_i1:132-1175(+)